MSLQHSRRAEAGRDPYKKYLDQLKRREYGGNDAEVAVGAASREPAIPPTPENAARVGARLARVAAHLAAPYRILERVEDLGKMGLVSPNMITAGKWYMALAVAADGPSVGVGRYGSGTGAGTPAWAKSLTNDDRMMARRVFDAARKAAFGMNDIGGRTVFDEAAREALEPILLGDAQAWTMGQVGRFLSFYDGKNSVSVSGTTEVVAVLRRLRTFFKMADD